MANNGPDGGIYRIVNGGSPYSKGYCLEVTGGNMTSGANVQIWGKLYAASQYWKIAYDKNGSARIVNLASGKSLDVYAGTMANGTNVRQFNDNGSAAQRWKFVLDGSEAVFDGEHYVTYNILSAKDNNFALDVNGGNIANKSNVQIYRSNGTVAQSWMFVPMEPFSSGGIYELRSMLKTSMCVDVAGGSNANGANIQLWAHSGSNAQKFYITEETSGQWSIKSVSSGKYIDVKGGASAVGTNVQQYADNDSRSQRWKLTQYGTTTIDGKVCAVVTFGSYVAGSGDTRLMDVRNAMTTNSANVQLGANEAGTDYSQRFALYPTNPKSNELVVPANLGWVTELGDTNAKTVLMEAETLYPYWTTATSWPTDSANSYEWRHREHAMSVKTGSWAEWGEWSAWEPVAVRVEGKRVWAADGLPAEVESGYKQLQYELQVRAVSYEGDSDEDDRTGGVRNVGEFAAATLTATQLVDVTIGETLGFGPEGLRIPYTSDYVGTVNLMITRITAGSGYVLPEVDLLRETVTFEDVDNKGSVLIPVSGFTRWLTDGETVSLCYTVVGNESFVDGAVHLWEPHAISYNTGSGMTVTPTVSIGEGRTLSISAVRASVSSVWIREGGVIRKMDTYENVASVIYPFGADLTWEIFVAARNSDGDRWGVAFVDGTQFNNLLSGMRPCHAFNWGDGRSFVLEVRLGEYLETDLTIENDAQAYKLNKREWDTYRFGDTKSGKYKAVGALYEPLDLESTREDLLDLIDARHVTYRSPNGDMCDVAVLGASMTCNRGIWTVTIDMARETV